MATLLPTMAVTPATTSSKMASRAVSSTQMATTPSEIYNKAVNDIHRLSMAQKTEPHKVVQTHSSECVVCSALRSSRVWFFTLLKDGPRTGPVHIFQKYDKNSTGPLQFSVVSGLVLTDPEPTSVLTSHRLVRTGYVLSTYVTDYLQFIIYILNKKETRKKKHLTIHPVSSGLQGWMWVHWCWTCHYWH